MNDREKRKYVEIIKPNVNAENLTRKERQTGRPTSFQYITPQEYIDIDCKDIIICIPSHDRYEKVKRLINQFYEQETKHSFKIILLNDGSCDLRYDTLKDDFSDIFYLKNDVANGKPLHWYCYNQMWNLVRDFKCYAILQMDDDFILSNNFLNTIVDLYFEQKIICERVMAVAPHLWSFKELVDSEKWWKLNTVVDGIALIDITVIKSIDYELQPVDVEAVCKKGAPVRAWTQISSAITDIRGIIYRTENSLVYHDGNDDSKLHGDVRNDGKNGVYTQRYIDNI